DPLQVLEQTGGRIDVRGPQQRQQRMIATENVQGQIAVFVVVAVEKTAQLMTVQRRVGGVRIENDPAGREQILLHEGLDQETLHRIQVADDFLVPTGAVSSDGSEFQAVERALARQGLAPVASANTLFAQRIFLVDQDRQQWIMAKLVVVVEIFI